jgi:hypothetical protein
MPQQLEYLSLAWSQGRWPGAPAWRDPQSQWAQQRRCGVDVSSGLQPYETVEGRLGLGPGDIGGLVGDRCGKRKLRADSSGN